MWKTVVAVSALLIICMHGAGALDVYIDGYGNVVTTPPEYGTLLWWPNPEQAKTGDDVCSQTLDVTSLSHSNKYKKDGWFHWEAEEHNGVLATSISLYNVQEFVSYAYYVLDMWATNSCDAINEVLFQFTRRMVENLQTIDMSQATYYNLKDIDYSVSSNGMKISLLCKPTGQTEFVQCTVANILETLNIVIPG
jgi:hypothetical protein